MGVNVDIVRFSVTAREVLHFEMPKRFAGKSTGNDGCQNEDIKTCFFHNGDKITTYFRIFLYICQTCSIFAPAFDKEAGVVIYTEGWVSG